MLYDVLVNRNGDSGFPNGCQLSLMEPAMIPLGENVFRTTDGDLARANTPLSSNDWLLEAATQKLKTNYAGGSYGAQ